MEANTEAMDPEAPLLDRPAGRTGQGFNTRLNAVSLLRTIRLPGFSNS